MCQTHKYQSSDTLQWEKKKKTSSQKEKPNVSCSLQGLLRSDPATVLLCPKHSLSS